MAGEQGEERRQADFRAGVPWRRGGLDRMTGALEDSWRKDAFQQLAGVERKTGVLALSLTSSLTGLGKEEEDSSWQQETDRSGRRTAAQPQVAAAHSLPHNNLAWCPPLSSCIPPVMCSHRHEHTHAQAKLTAAAHQISLPLEVGGGEALRHSSL